MKRLVALMMCAVSLGSAAQFPSLPYNPDGNNDGAIGVSDLQDFLSIYGSEFELANLSVNLDSTVAIYDAGGLRYPACEAFCEFGLTGNWHVASLKELGTVYDDFLENEIWLNRNEFSGYNADGQAYVYYVETIGQHHDLIRYHELKPSKRCLCSLVERPKIEYSFCQGEAPDDALLNQCISGKLADGWYPLAGFPNHRDRQPAGGVNNNGYYNQINFQPYTHASFWRWAE